MIDEDKNILSEVPHS